MDEYSGRNELAEEQTPPEQTPPKRVVGRGKAFGHFTLLFSALVAMIVVTTVFRIVAVFLVEYYAPQLQNENWYLWALSLVPMYCVGLPVAVIIMLFAERDNDVTEKKKLSFGRWLKLLCVAFAFMYAGNLLGISVTSVIELIPGLGTSNVVSDMLSGTPIWISFIATAVLAPLVEELLFRKLLIDRMSAYGEKLAVFISGLAFGLFHGNFSQFFYAFFLGLLFGYVYVKTRNVWYTITMHATINLISGVVMGYLADKLAGAEELREQLMQGNVTPEMLGDIVQYIIPALAIALISTLIIAAAICGAVFFFKDVKKVRFETSKYDIPKKSVLCAVYANPGAIIFALVCAFTFIQSIIETV